jgi:hypothetical protein
MHARGERNARRYALSRAASRVLISAIVAEADATESARSFLSSSRSSVDIATIAYSFARTLTAIPSARASISRASSSGVFGMMSL